jgi:probable rRNA maturation factor
MNRIRLSMEDEPPPRWSKSFKNYAQKILAELGRDKWDLSIFICGDRTMSSLNSRYRGKQETTDVLSFAMGEGEKFPSRSRRCLSGDIVISLDAMNENARRFNISGDEELRRLLIHGILHLDGLNHRTNANGEPMLQLQERILARIEGDIGYSVPGHYVPLEKNI